MVIFVCGVVTGALVIKTQGNGPLRSRSPGEGQFGAPGAAQVRETMRLMSSLELTTNQYDKIVTIIEDSQATNRAIRETYAPLLHKEVDRAHQAISNVLASEQQVKYAELLKNEPRPDVRGGRGPRGGEGGGGFQLHGSNHPPTSGFPSFPNGFGGPGRGRMDRMGSSNNPLSNGLPTNAVPSNAVPTNAFPANSVSTNNSTNGP
jgi:hypothetical protein